MARTETRGANDAFPGPAATVSGLVRIYSTATGETHALRGVDAEFDTCTVTALTGPSGSGKSTLLALLALRHRPSGGEVTILGRNAASLRTRERRVHSRRTIAWVPQRPTDGVFPHLTAAQNVEQAARWRGASPVDEVGLIEPLACSRWRTCRHPGCREASSSGWARLALLPQRLGLPAELTVRENVSLSAWMRGQPERPELLEAFDLAHLVDRLTGQASRGEQQRVALARAASLQPQVIVLDEPTSHQDETHADLIADQLLELAHTGSAVLVATHDPRLVGAADRVVHLNAGQHHEPDGR